MDPDGTRAGITLMKFSVKMPRVSETLDDVVVMEWDVEPGSRIQVGDVLLRVETEKAVVEVPSPVSGQLVRREVSEGDEIKTGTVLAIIDSESAS